MDKQKKFKRIKNFVPSKKMGQNFLTDDSVARSIVDLIDVGEYDLVVEVGPGMGALTQYLIQFKQKVIAIELDKRLVEQLQHKFDKYSNLQVINDDILEIDLCQLVTEYKRVVMVSNLPYSISTPMLFQFFKQNKIQTFYCMLQRELVDRLIAKPGSKNYGSISVVTQSYVTIAKLLNVSPQAFSPAPKVESSVIVMNKLAKNFDEK
jgi:16S rRNA (adenine1518-N6/adenine1519-N6)-dimethyltransferase